MSASPFRFVSNGLGGYSVVERATGDVLGRVSYHERRWNLRRVLVSRWWRAVDPEGRVVVDNADTRAEAARHLAHHAGLTGYAALDTRP